MASILLAILKLPFYLLLEVVYFILRCRPKKQIKNEHILITGAAQGIGAEFARQFSEMGNTVHCVDINAEMIKETVDALKSKGHKAFAYTCDLTNPEQVEGLFNEISAAGHTITVLVNNAGVVFGASLTQMSLTQIQHSVNVNLTSNMWLIKLFLPKMLDVGKGHIINIASMAGMAPMKNSTDYCSTKAGSIHMMTQLRMQNVGTNIKFTAVCPSYVKTKMISGVEDLVDPILPEDMVSVSIKAARENREVVIVCPLKFRILLFLLKVVPISVRDVMFQLSHDKLKTAHKRFVGQRMIEKIR